MFVWLEEAAVGEVLELAAGLLALGCADGVDDAEGEHGAGGLVDGEPVGATCGGGELDKIDGVVHGHGAGGEVVEDLHGSDGFVGLLEVFELEDGVAGLAPEEDDGSGAAGDPGGSVDVVEGAGLASALLGLALVVDADDLAAVGEAHLQGAVEAGAFFVA